MKNIGTRADFFGNYPAGAADDPRAPYNQAELPEQTFAVEAGYNLSRTAEVSSTCYDGTELEDPVADYTDSYLSPVEVMQFAARCAKALLAKHRYALGSRWHLRDIIRSADGWQVDDIDVQQADFSQGNHLQ